MRLCDDGETGESCVEHMPGDLRGMFSRRTAHEKKSYLVSLSPHLFFTSFMWDIKGIYSPAGVLQPTACTRSRSKQQSMFLLSNLNSYISSTPTPTETSHFRADLAGCASAV